jgi:hypothetical protein
MCIPARRSCAGRLHMLMRMPHVRVPLEAVLAFSCAHRPQAEQRGPGVGASAFATSNGPSAGSSAAAAAPVPLPPGMYRPTVGTSPLLTPRSPSAVIPASNACRQAPLRVNRPTECELGGRRRQPDDLLPGLQCGVRSKRWRLEQTRGCPGAQGGPHGSGAWPECAVVRCMRRMQLGGCERALVGVGW